MLTCCWSVKGGAGTTVVAAVLARRYGTAESPALVVDLAGDVPAVLGVADPAGPGVAEWSRGEAGAVPVAALSVRVADGLRVLPRGRGCIDVGGLAALDHPGPVVVDAGTLAGPGDPMAALVVGAPRSLLVIRPCYLALRRAVLVGIRPTGIVLVEEPGRALGAADVAEVVGAPVEALVPLDAGIARAVDAGLLATRVPAAIERALGVRR